ncbi:MAG: hypothetical protein AAF348_17985 [Bacteroidota bacterium]
MGKIKNIGKELDRAGTNTLLFWVLNEGRYNLRYSIENLFRYIELMVNSIVYFENIHKIHSIVRFVYEQSKDNDIPNANPEIWWLSVENGKTGPLMNTVNANYAHWSK